MNNTFKILSVDGGGIKGLFSSTILEKIESKYGPTSDYFDLLCGTSTGGLIVLALSLKIPAEDVSELYRREGPKIFPTKYTTGNIFWKKIGLVKQLALKGKYTDKALKQALYEIFGDRRIGDSNNLLCIPTYNITHNDNTVIKFDHEFLVGRDNEAKYVDVALATAAAPTYFPLAQLGHLNNDQFIDGGIWANNPVLVGLLEALKYFVGPSRRYDSIEILSISSLNIKKGNPKLSRFRSFRHWNSELFEAGLTGQSKFIDYYMTIVSDLTNIPVKYYRIEGHEIASSQERFILIDRADSEALRLMRSMGERIASEQIKRGELQSFYSKKKSFNIK